MKIVIQSIPHDHHRYPTLGDYWLDEDGALQIRVSQLPDRRDMAALALHELVEAMLCLDRMISFEEITAFDQAHLEGPYSDDPGHHPQAPYHHEHVFAEIMERMLAHELGRNWQDYERAVAALDARERPITDEERFFAGEQWTDDQVRRMRANSLANPFVKAGRTS